VSVLCIGAIFTQTHTAVAFFAAQPIGELKRKTNYEFSHIGDVVLSCFCFTYFLHLNCFSTALLNFCHVLMFSSAL